MVHVCRGHRPIVDTCANEAIPQWGKRRLITSVYLQFRLSWQGAKPRTPTREILVLHGCRNLRFYSISFSTLFAWYFYNHGEGLSREPYIDYFPYFGPYLMAFLVTTVISEYLPLFEWYYLGYRVSHRICTLKDSVPDGSLKKTILSSESRLCMCIYIYTYNIICYIQNITAYTYRHIMYILYVSIHTQYGTWEWKKMFALDIETISGTPMTLSQLSKLRGGTRVHKAM